MRQLLIALVLATATFGARAAEPPDQLQPVRTLAELKAVEPVDAGDGWSVRLGYGELEPESGARWLVLYCLAEHAEEPAAERQGHAAQTGEPLGPVPYVWERVSDMPQVRVERIAAEIGRPGLYCATLPAHGEAAMQLAVHDRATNRVIGERMFPAGDDGPRPAYWQSFAVAAPRKDAGDDPAALVALGDRAALVADETLAVYPRFREAAVGMPKGEAGDDDDLPGLGGEREADALKLSLDGGTFTIVAERPMPGSPWENLVARWWLNGKPVEVPGPGALRKSQQMQRAAHEDRFEVSFGLPDHLPALKVGDRIGLQVMYAPGGHRPLPTGGLKQMMQRLRHAAHQDVVDRPLLSNRLEFELTEDLLRQADHPPVK